MRNTFVWLFVLLVMISIFLLSNQPVENSRALSISITEYVMKVVEKISPDTEISMWQLHHYIRKTAHFIAYLLLGLVVMHAIRKMGKFRYGGVVLAFGICVIYAILDEFHQLFVPGRGAEVRDVLIDSVGAAVGIGIYWLVVKMYDRKTSAESM